MQQEQRLLRALAFDTNVELPQRLLLNCLRVLRAPRALCELSSALLNDNMAHAARVEAGSSSAAAGVLAAAAIELGACMLRVRLPARWWLALSVQEEAVGAACHRMLDSYTSRTEASQSGVV